MHLQRTAFFVGLALTATLLTSGAAHAVLLWGSTGNSNVFGGGRLYSIDTSSQAVNLIGDTGLDRLGGVAFTSTGVLYGVSGGSAGPASLYTLSTVNAAATLVGAVTGIQGVDALAFDAAGTLYGGGWSGVGTLVTIDTATGGVLTSLAMSGSGNSFVAGLGFDASGQLYGSRGNAFGHLEDLVSINTLTGAHTAIGGSTDIISDIVFATDGSLYGAATNGDLFSINVTTGAKSFLFNTGIGQLSGLTQNPIPEPTTLLLLGPGLLAFRLLRRRQA